MDRLSVRWKEVQSQPKQWVQSGLFDSESDGVGYKNPDVPPTRHLPTGVPEEISCPGQSVGHGWEGRRLEDRAEQKTFRS